MSRLKIPALFPTFRYTRNISFFTNETSILFAALKFFFQREISCVCYFIRYEAREVGKPLLVEWVRSSLHDARIGKVAAFEFGGSFYRKIFPSVCENIFCFKYL